jgi:hypothetical protein
MALGRRPREVYRACSEEELLAGEQTVDQLVGEPPLAEFSAERAAAHTPTLGTRRTGRSVAVTLLATLIGLAVGLGVVTLIERGTVSHPAPTSAGSRASNRQPVALATAPKRPSPTGARTREARRARRSSSGEKPPARLAPRRVSRAPREGAPQPLPGLGVAEPRGVPPAAASAPAAGAPAAALPVAPREVRSEFGFER